MANYSTLGYHIVEKKSTKDLIDLEKVTKNLSRYGINSPIDNIEFTSFDNSIEFPYLGLDGDFNYQELIESLAETSCGEDISLIDDFYQQIKDNGIPKVPMVVIKPGWVKYDFNGKCLGPIEYPDEEILVFDTETYVKGNNLPIIATAVSTTNSYIWIAKEFCENIPIEDYDQLKLVPLPKTRIIIGHNINFDLCRVRDAYKLPVAIKSLDTLSMHLVSNGLCSAQRYASLLEQKDPNELTWKEKAILRNPPAWLQHGSTNSLVAVYNFHVANEKSFFEESTVQKLTDDDKEIREVFVKTDTMEDFVNMGPLRYKLLEYAAKDTYYTTEIFKSLYPKYLETKPSKIALAGHLLLSSARVPLADNWDEWINNCESLLTSLNEEVSIIFREECNTLYKNWCDGKLSAIDINKDFFLRQLDWSIKRKKVNKNYSSPIVDKLRNGEIPVCLQDYYEQNGDKIFKGNYTYIPNWYSNLFKDPNLIITPKTELSHLILRLHYNGYPLYKHKNKGWGYWIDDDTFEKVKSYGTPGKNVGNVLSKDYIDDMKNGVLTGEHPKSKRIFEIAIQTSFWISTRSRVIERFYINTTSPVGSPFKLMVPQPIVHGTTTGRVTENLFLVMSSPKYNKIGSEIKSKIVAPRGYKMVSSDFDAQELVLASLYGDKESGGELGSCPLTYRTLLGTKENFSDIHSSTAYNLFLKPKGYVFKDGEWYIETTD